MISPGSAIVPRPRCGTHGGRSVEASPVFVFWRRTSGVSCFGHFGCICSQASRYQHSLARVIGKVPANNRTSSDYRCRLD